MFLKTFSFLFEFESLDFFSCCQTFDDNVDVDDDDGNDDFKSALVIFSRLGRKKVTEQCR